MRPRFPQSSWSRFYELCRHLGGSQTDIARLNATDIDWDQRVVSYFRQKTDSPALIHFGEQLAAVLKQLPKTGPLFPYLRSVRGCDRATEFKQRCTGVGIDGVTRPSFGVPELDALLRPAQVIPNNAVVQQGTPGSGQSAGTPVVPEPHYFVACIEGSAGSGKSTLALHCAAQHAKMGATVIYISTDWSFAQALGLWDSYNLGLPASPLDGDGYRYAGPDAHSGPDDDANPDKRVELKPLQSKAGEYVSNSSKSAAELIADRVSPLTDTAGRTGEVYFLDLSREDLGDEWSFTERFLGSLKRPSQVDKGAHDLVVVDSLPGLEVLSGQIDSYGSQVGAEVHLSRLIRLASESRMDLLYTAGSAEPAGRNMRAEAQADFVYQLAADTCYGTPKRQLRIVKARGYSHLLAPSIIEFRNEKATYSSAKEDLDHKARSNYYAYLYPSLGSLLASIKEKLLRIGDNSDPSEERAVCATGIQFLDNLLVRASSSERSTQAQPTSSLADRFGVPAGTALSVVGDQHTHKSAVGMAFARYTFTRIGRRVFGLLQVSSEKEPKEEDCLPPLPLRSVNSWHRYRLESIADEDFGVGIRNGVRNNTNTFIAALRSGSPGGDRSYILDLKRIVRRLWKEIGKVESSLEQWHALPLPKFKVESVSDLNEGENARILQVRRILRLCFLIASRPTISRRALLVTTRFVMLQDFARKAAHYMAMRFDPQIGGILDFLQEEVSLSPKARFELARFFRSDFTEYYETLILDSLDYRRLVGSDVVPSILFDIVRRCSFEILARMKIKAAEDPPQLGQDRFKWLAPVSAEESVRLRIVVDDLRAVREAAVRASRGEEFEDFLSTLTTFLRARNLTSCLIESSSGDSDGGGLGPLGRPERVISVNVSKVRFKGGSRVAISVDPAVQNDYHGVVRELKLVELKSSYAPYPRMRIPFVDPDFELYENLGTGDPKVVGLKVMLYRETKGWERYYSEVNSFLGRVVTSNVETKTPEIVFPVEPKDYITLQDLATFQNSADLPCTLVLQVDGYWALRREGDLRNLTHYLKRQLDSGFEFERAKEDQFFAYVARVSSRSNGDTSTGGTLDAKNRLEQYQLISPSARNGVIYCPHFPRSDDGERWDDFIDRIPFTWDFGFLLVEDTFKDDLLGYLGVKRDSKMPCIRMDTWEHFLKACEKCAVAKSRSLGEALVPFRLGADFPETMDSVVLEMLFSDLVSGGHLKPELLELLSGDQMKRQMVESDMLLQDGLISLLRASKSTEKPGEELPRLARSAFMRSIRLLAIAMLPRKGSKLLDPKDCKSLRYIAARHWYKTAASETNPELGGTSSGRRYTVFPLPGLFSTRGDWYLGIAKGSRSIRLGELAIDALTDIEQNVRRLRLGIGLPVRNIFSPDKSDGNVSSVATAIQEWRDTGICRALGLEQFFERAAGQAWVTELDSKARGDGCGGFAEIVNPTRNWWLWRSALGGYDWQAEPFRIWLRETVEGIQAMELASADDPVDDESGQDRTGERLQHKVMGNDLTSEDESRIDTLIGILRAVTPARQGSEVL